MINIQTRKKHIRKDFFIIVLSIIVTVILYETHALDEVVRSTAQLGAWGSFLAGIFFTSIFTITPAGVVLAELAANGSLIQVAVFGAAGAVLGDLFIYLYIRDTLAPDIIYLVKSTKSKRLKHFFHLRIWRWLTPLLGALIIASPLPDELGLSMMGLTRMKAFILIPISFTCNFVGILLISWALL